MDDREKPLVFIDREGRPGGGKGILISKDLTFTLSGLRQYLMAYEDDRISDPIPEGACTRGGIPHP